MSIQKQRWSKGTVIIVGKQSKNENEYKIDGVILYDALALSNSTPYLLQEMSKEVVLHGRIFLLGHGISTQDKRKISGYDMDSLEKELLTRCNLSNVNEIVIVSCYANSNGKNSITRDLRKRIKKSYQKIKVIGMAKYSTVVINSSPMIEVYDVNLDSKIKNCFITLYQEITLGKNNEYSITINKDHTLANYIKNKNLEKKMNAVHNLKTHIVSAAQKG